MNEFFFGPIDNRPVLWAHYTASLLMVGILVRLFLRHLIGPWYLDGSLVLVILFALAGPLTRVWALALLALFYKINVISMIHLYGVDSSVMFYLIYSFWIGNPRKPATWAVRMLQIQLLLVYTFCALNKIYAGPGWRHGTALAVILANSHYSAWPWPKLLDYAWFTKPLTWYSLVAEGLFPWLTFNANLRRVMVLLLVSFHGIMALCMPVIAIYTLTMVPCALLLLCHQQENV